MTFWIILTNVNGMPGPPPKHDERRNIAVALLRRGLIDVATAALWCHVSKQRVHQWCARHGIDPKKAARDRMTAALIKAEAKMDRRKRKPTEDKRHHAGMMAPLLRSEPRPPKGPSKEAMRDEAERLVAEFNEKQSRKE